MIEGEERGELERLSSLVRMQGRKRLEFAFLVPQAGLPFNHSALHGIRILSLKSDIKVDEIMLIEKVFKE